MAVDCFMCAEFAAQRLNIPGVFADILFFITLKPGVE